MVEVLNHVVVALLYTVIHPYVHNFATPSNPFSLSNSFLKITVFTDFVNRSARLSADPRVGVSPYTDRRQSPVTSQRQTRQASSGCSRLGLSTDVRDACRVLYPYLLLMSGASRFHPIPACCLLFSAASCCNDFLWPSTFAAAWLLS